MTWKVCEYHYVPVNKFFDLKENLLCWLKYVISELYVDVEMVSSLGVFFGGFYFYF